MNVPHLVLKFSTQSNYCLCTRKLRRNTRDGGRKGYRIWGSAKCVPVMLINQKAMMSPMVSLSALFNRLKANKELTKPIPEEHWPLQIVSIDLSLDRCWIFQFVSIFPKREFLHFLVICGSVEWNCARNCSLNI